MTHSAYYIPFSKTSAVLAVLLIALAGCSKKAASSSAEIRPPGTGYYKIDNINYLRLSILTNHGDQRALLSELMANTSDGDVVIRAGTFAALGGVSPAVAPEGRAAIVKALAVGLEDPSPPVRAAAAESAGRMGGIAAPLVSSLAAQAEANPGTSVAFFCVRSLGKIGAQGELVVPALLNIISRNRAPGQPLLPETIPAVEALASFKEQSDEIVRSLERRLGDRNLEFLGAVSNTIVALDPGVQSKQIETALTRLAEAQMPMQRIQAVFILDKLSVRTVGESDLLNRLAQDSNPAVKYAAERRLTTAQ